MIEAAGAVDPTIVDAVVRTVRRDVFDWAVLLGSVGVAVGTLLLAVSTRKMARAAQDQLDWYRDRDRAERTPRLYVRDIWVRIATRALKVDEAWPLNLETKGLANMGAYSVAIHDVYIADSTGVSIARAQPMLIVGAGDAVLPKPSAVREVAFFTQIWPADPKLLPGHLAERAEMLVLEFRYGADTSQVWEFRLPRGRDPDMGLWFSGETELPRLKV